MKDQLNQAQQQVVCAGDGPQLILAGAGSGKTRTIIQRIVHLIEERQVPPHRILAVTFTNKAAAELKERLQEQLGDAPVMAGTFHSISLRLLRNYASYAGYPSSFQVMDSQDQKSLIKRLLKERHLSTQDLHPNYVLSWIEQCKHEGLGSDQAPTHDFNGINIAEIYQAYQQRLKQLERMDFNDLLLILVQIMKAKPDIAILIRGRFDHVLVDEYQDTNPLQDQWLHLLCCEHRNLTVVGDDDQSIYGWRGANIEHIMAFEKNWHPVEVHRLEDNYRSYGAILALANAVIVQNKHRHSKELRPAREMGDKPMLMACQDDGDEARRITAWLKQHHRDGVSTAEMAVLYRSNRQSLALEQILSEQDMTYRVIGGLRFFDRMEIKDALAYWALLHRCGDRLHLERICNNPRRGIGPKTQQDLINTLMQSGMRLSAWLDMIAHTPADKKIAKLSPLGQALMKVRQDCLSSPDLGLLAILEATGYLTALQTRGEIEFESRMENLRELQKVIIQSSEEGKTPAEIMDLASLMQDTNDASSQQSISLMSLHRAKGLEFEVVAIAGVEESLLPHERAITEGNEGISEERRLLYVGITRAKNHLLLSWARTRRIFGDVIYPQPSRFLRNLDDYMRPYRINPQQQHGDYPQGTAVKHRVFGHGEIIEQQGYGDAIRVVVKFKDAGIKRLMLKYAQFE
ncbi:MAG: UvrD-helicase domain-containing protein [Mariprofundaceae bacterium]|nr:UvrD-helicase domain-containing protein [Mariprofundaceae bacterium]